ncbi:MAG: translation initiation factor IF-3 [Pseudobdellovibrionaceae bacterium]
MNNRFEKPGNATGPGAGGAFNREKKRDKDSLRVNREIRAQQIRVIDEEGVMLGVMTVPEALRLAEDRGLDLLEIAPTAAPPTCKIMDYGKWKYENKKKATAARKKQVIVLIKEVQLRPRTDQHDFETKMNHSRRFLLDGNKVKISLRFLGREMAHQELGLDLLKKCVKFVEDLAMVESNPKMEGKQLFLLLAPDPIKIKDYLKKHPEKAG